MVFHDLVQGSLEWHQARRGVPTASEFHRVLSPKKRHYSTGAQGYINQLLDEKFSKYLPERAESFTSRPMQWGRDNEEQARRFLAFDLDWKVTNGGFCLTDDGRFGCSPDGLIGDDGSLELKCPTGAVHMSYIRGGILPREYMCQVHGQLIVTGRKWVQFMSYDPAQPIELQAFMVRVTPDDFTTALRIALERFWMDYSAALKHILKVRGQ